MVKKNMNEGKKGAEKNQRKNIRTQQFRFLAVSAISGNFSLKL
jgi:hypothetical protein